MEKVIKTYVINTRDIEVMMDNVTNILIDEEKHIYVDKFTVDANSLIIEGFEKEE